MLWEKDGPLRENREASLRFKVLDATGRPVSLQPYMGMLGHAAVRRDDGTVFAHLHPVGSISMASQEFFTTGAKAPNRAPASPTPPERKRAAVGPCDNGSFGTSVHHRAGGRHFVPLRIPKAWPLPNLGADQEQRPRDDGRTIVEQFQRLGASCDYEDERFTLDEGYVEAVQKVFVDLYEKGLIYRDNYMVNWDPGHAVGDLGPGGRGP